MVQRQEGGRSLERKGHRKVGTANLNQMVPAENTGLPPLPNPGCDLPPPPLPTDPRTNLTPQVLESLW